MTEPEGVITHGIGNYSIDMQCTWLIDGTDNRTIQLYVDDFATECGWDHVYIYDGDSVYSNLLAVYRWAQGAAPVSWGATWAGYLQSTEKGGILFIC